MKCTWSLLTSLVTASDHEPRPVLYHVWYWPQPKNYLDFITNYKRSLAAQRKEISDCCRPVNSFKLVQASAEVDVLQRELNKAKVVVETATQECNQLLEVCHSKHTMLQRCQLGHA